MSAETLASAGPGRRTELLRGVVQALEGLAALVREEVDEEEARAGAAADDPLLLVAEVAAELRCSETLVRSACRNKELAAMPNPWRIRRSAVRAYERRRTYGRGARGAAA